VSALRRLRTPWTAVAVLCVAYATYFSWLTLHRYAAFGAGRYDLGNMVQAVWSASRWELFRVTDGDGAQLSRLGGHVDPILGAFAPLWKVWPDPRMLLVAQAIIVATTAIPAFMLARRWLAHDGLAVAFAAAALLYPGLQFANVFDFHPVTLAAPLILWTIWAAVARRDVLLVVFAVLALMTKEQVGLCLAVFGIWMVVSLGRKRAGTILAAGSFVWSLVAIFVIIPAFSVSGTNQIVASRYGDLGDGPGDVARTLVTRPWDAVEVVATLDRFWFVLALTAPLLLLCLRAPLLTAGALPDLAINLLSSAEATHRIEYHYAALAAPFVIAGSIRGLAAIRDGRGPRVLEPAARRSGIVAMTLIAASVVAGWRLGPLPIWKDVPGSGTPLAVFRADPREASLQAALAMVPEDAVVSAGNYMAARLSARPRILTFPVVADAQYVVIDQARPAVRDTVNPPLHRALVAALRADPAFELVFDRERVLVFRRRAAA
jgi:uncharacterized membrane protein